MSPQLIEPILLISNNEPDIASNNVLRAAAFGSAFCTPNSDMPANIPAIIPMSIPIAANVTIILPILTFSSDFAEYSTAANDNIIIPNAAVALIKSSNGMYDNAISIPAKIPTATAKAIIVPLAFPARPDAAIITLITSIRAPIAVVAFFKSSIGTPLITRMLAANSNIATPTPINIAPAFAAFCPASLETIINAPNIIPAAMTNWVPLSTSSGDRLAAFFTTLTRIDIAILVKMNIAPAFAAFFPASLETVIKATNNPSIVHSVP